MNTAAPSRKKLLSLVLTLVFMLTCLPAALAVDLNVDAGCYFKQSRGGTCTLASAAMMLRRRAYFDGLTDWSTVTENSVRSTAWSNGLSHSFTYKEMQVGYGTLPSRKQEKVQTLITLLSQHPEGIVLYDRGQPHAVLLTDYTNGTFYCSDPAGNISSGRIPLENSSVSEVFIVIIRIMMERPMLMMSRKSSSSVLMGIMRKRTMITTPSDIALSMALPKTFFTPVSPSPLCILNAPGRRHRRLKAAFLTI